MQKTIFLLLNKFKSTESAQLCGSEYRHRAHLYEILPAVRAVRVHVVLLAVVPGGRAAVRVPVVAGRLVGVVP